MICQVCWLTGSVHFSCFKLRNYLSSLFINMYNEEVASLVLRVGDLTANSTNAVGTSNQFHTNMTWSNINLRTLLGPMYEKYDSFNLVPTSYQSTVADGGIGGSSDDRCVSINISGLPFSNNVYNSATKTNQNSSVIYTTRFIASDSINGLV